jgi:hypothetical protein
LRADWQSQLLLCHRELGFQHVCAFMPGKAVRQMKLTGVPPKPGEMFQTERIA